MIVFKLFVVLAFVCACHRLTDAESLTLAHAATVAEELNTCEEQLSKYRKFILQAIISFEDVCDAYNARPLTEATASGAYYRGIHDTDMPQATPTIFRNYQPPEQRSEIWAFFKLLMAQFNDLEFTNVIRDAVIDRCRIKSQQRDEKRNSVVLGKKQRFHSWGGKRSSLLASLEERLGDHTGERSYII